ncbi:hypothetical protein LAZ67_6003404 [Cordylochernes scorpioides]|uniref:Histone-lysine N-methyltransferase SETMAR n=1 Tax=Cordylochernes scorpioides TaxID=51811 RepID=A0ABY6KKK0_9ARAC|nr:hypothetical protein LAZ67_6003404 [Cordylochernes scorpioides]
MDNVIKNPQIRDGKRSDTNRTTEQLVNRKGTILLHSNVRPHVSIITRQKLNELGCGTLDHPPYSSIPLIYRLPLFRAPHQLSFREML